MTPVPQAGMTILTHVHTALSHPPEPHMTTNAKPIREKAMIFSAPMIQAILSGRKTMTRRVIKPQPDFVQEGGPFVRLQLGVATMPQEIKCPYPVGTRLWVKEAWRIVGWREGEPLLIEFRDGKRMEDNCGSFDFDEQQYVRLWEECTQDCEAAGLKSDNDGQYRFDERGPITRWHNPLFMPRWASRIDLEVMAVKVEQVQDISEADAEAEGVFRHVAEYSLNKVFRDQRGPTAIKYFRELWTSIHGEWNPELWVWAITFRTLPDLAARRDGIGGGE